MFESIAMILFRANALLMVCTMEALKPIFRKYLDDYKFIEYEVDEFAQWIIFSGGVNLPPELKREITYSTWIYIILLFLVLSIVNYISSLL